MTVEEVLQRCGGLAPYEAVAPGWEASMACLPGGALPFLDPDAIDAARGWAGIDAAHQAELADTARRINADPALKALAWHAYRRLYEHDEGWLHDWPGLEGVLGEQAGVFYLLLGLAMVPLVRATHARLGIPGDVSRDTCKQLQCAVLNHALARNGRLGALRDPLGWLRHYVAGRLFRLGRFEYKLEPFDRGAYLYRHRATGRVAALAAPGLEFDAQGLRYVERDPDWRPAWTSTLHRDAQTVRGYPIHPAGHALRREVTLPLDAWECAVKPGDTQIDLHIPAGGGMTPEACVDSMRQAAAFFAEYFPDRPSRVFGCDSWIFGPQLERILPDAANLVRFMREVYLIPCETHGSGGLWFVFFTHDVDPATAPRDTALKRAILDYFAEGGVWRCAAMAYLVDDLDAYGRQPYRAPWPETAYAMGLPQHGAAPKPGSRWNGAFG